MEFSPYQIVAPAISLVAIAYAWNLVMRQKKTLWEALLWTVFWGAIAIIALFPDSLAYLSDITGIQDRENAALVTAIGVLFFIVFYIIIRLEELEQRHTKMVRKVAMRNAGLETMENE